MVVLEAKLVDLSPRPDVVTVQAALSAAGKTPREQLAAHLEGLGYVVVDDARAQTAVQSLGAQAGSCTDVDCAARVAGGLGARRAVVARVIKVSPIVWVLEGMIVDAAAKRVLRREQLELKGDGVELMPHATRSLARRLAAADPP